MLAMPCRLLSDRDPNLYCKFVHKWNGMPTRCVMTHDAEPIVRPLQNHLPVVTHLTTAAGLAIPQNLAGLLL